MKNVVKIHRIKKGENCPLWACNSSSDKKQGGWYHTIAGKGTIYINDLAIALGYRLSDKAVKDYDTYTLTGWPFCQSLCEEGWNNGRNGMTRFYNTKLEAQEAIFKIKSEIAHFERFCRSMLKTGHAEKL